MPNITREVVTINRNFLFIFGDNDMRCGYGGQAKDMRGERNTHGIRMKKAPSMSRGSFYTDYTEAERTYNKNTIGADLTAMDIKSQQYDAIVFPTKGIGTGMAQLHENAPSTYLWLKCALESRGVTCQPTR